MLILITYDVSTTTKEGRRRLRRVARACQNFGQRVQLSVFECNVGEREWALLRSRLLAAFCADEDSLRFYHLPEDAVQRAEHHGVRGSVDFEGPLIA
jgi:CRISPR-associated protein Cas2